MWDHPCSLDDKTKGVSTPGVPALQALQPKYTKDWSLHPPPIACRDQEHICGSSPLSLACPHHLQTFSHGFPLAVPPAVIWERTGREETAELLSKQLNPQDLLWLLPHPHPGRRFQSRAEQSIQGCPKAPALPWAGCASSEQSPASRLSWERAAALQRQRTRDQLRWRVRHRNKPKHYLYVWRCTFMNVVYIALF